ncbi:MAG: response regulator [Desulforegulaceae bacterium]|nr:response regulator [Desulforegulaceae bacterium]
MENVKIMVVENNPMVNSLIKDVMMFCVNREIMSFSSDDEAIRYMQSSGIVPDLVISRYKNQGVSPGKIVGYIKAKNKKSIFVFSSDAENDKERVQKDGGDAFLSIPFSISDLFKIVDDFVVG